MSKVITFSTVFPSYHPRKGEPTFFVEKICAGLADNRELKMPEEFKFCNYHEYYNCKSPKFHTIRAGNRWKVGDKFSPRIWTGKPYASKQAAFSCDLEIKKVWNIGLRVSGDFKEFYCGDCDLTATSISLLAKNDGLQLNDLFNWFQKPFTGQIICWNENINY